MEVAAIHRKLDDRFGAAVGALVEGPHEPHIEVDGAAVDEVCRFLRDEAELAFDHLSNLTAVDFPAENAIRVVYRLRSYGRNAWLTLKATLDRDNPHAATVEGVWPVANWLEREAFDLVGVVFDGHSDLRRILMPEDWEGHPLRKDFVEPSHYHGIATVRESMLTIDRNGK